MTNNDNILTASFPRSFRGYSPIAVDDFVRQLGARLETLQARLNEQTDKNAVLETALNSANRDLAIFIEKETAISQGIITIEQRRVSVEHEIELARTNAELEIAENLATARTEAEEMGRIAREASNEILASARQIADDTVESARNTAEETTALARSAADLQADRLRALCADYDEATSRIRRTLEAQLSLLPQPNSLLQSLSFGSVAVTTSSSVESKELEHAA